MITRRGVLLAGGIGLLVAHRLSLGQPAATVRRVGWVSLGSEATVANLDATFRQGMHDLGYDGFLMGSHFMRQADPGKALQELKDTLKCA